MNILYTCDDNYVWLMGISAISLFESNQNVEDLTVYLLGENISKHSKEKLDEIARKYKRTINVVDVSAIKVPESLISGRWPLSAFTRLYSAQLLSNDIERIIYLDCDTIIKGNIFSLEEIDFKGNYVLGVKDCIGKSYKQNIGLEDDEVYINAGVLLLNLKELRKLNIHEMIEQYTKSYEKYISYADQDILNGAFRRKIGIIAPQYNVMTIDVVHSYKEIIQLRKPTNFYNSEEMLKAVDEPKIIHYTTNMRVIRPWFCNANHPMTQIFREYMQISPWSGGALHKMKFTDINSKIIGTIEILPKAISYPFLGLIHSIIKPWVIRKKAAK